MQKIVKSILGAGVALALVAGTAYAATVVVHPGDMDGWTSNTSGTSSSVTFENGPGTPPLGSGSVELSVGADGNGAAQVRNASYGGTLLSSLTELSYSTFVDQDGSGGQAPYIILHVDYTNDGVYDDLLFFEPVYQDASFFPSNPQSSIVLDTWQTWDALIGGWWSVNGTAGATPGTGVKSLQDILAVESDATIVNTASGLGGLRVVAGFGAGAWDNFVGNVDNVTVNGTTYDFELEEPGPVVNFPTSKDACKKGGWQTLTDRDGNPFKNQGQCVSAVSSNK
jgi:hypothetical protein